MQKWVFIVGCNNSGTTLLHHLIASHPYVGTLPCEGQKLTKCFVFPRDVNVARIWTKKLDLFRMDDKTTINADAVKQAWLSNFDDNTKPIFIEKSPPNTVRMLWLQKHFFQAYFIGIIRNGYAVASGISRRELYPIGECAKHWATVNQIMLDDFQQINNYILLRYEDLTKNPVEIVQKIYHFLKLRSDLVDLDKIVREFSSESLNSFVDSFNYGKNPINNMNANAIKRLSKIDIDSIERNAQSMLNLLGYNIENF